MALPPDPPEMMEDLPPELPAQGIGPHFEINAEGRIDLAPPEALDAVGNYLPTLRSLHPELREMAAALARRLPKGNNTHPLLGDRIAAYAALIDQDLAGVDFRRLYMAGMRLANALRATDAAIASGEAPTLNVEAREEIDSLLEGHGPFIMASRAGAEAVAAAVAYRRQPEEEREYRVAATEFAGALAANPAVITEVAAETVRDAAADIGEGGQPERGTVAGQSVLRSVITVAVGGAVLFALPPLAGGLIGGLAGAGAGVALSSLLGILGAEVIKQSKAFQDIKAPMTRAVDGISHGEIPKTWEKFRTLLAPLHGLVMSSRQVLRRLRSARFEDEGIERSIVWLEKHSISPPPPGLVIHPEPASARASASGPNVVIGPPPEFSQAAAEAMILAGRAVPDAWRPFVTQLGFGRLTFDGSGGPQIRDDGFQTGIDLSHLEDLTSLQRLSLDSMKITSIESLENFRSLIELNISNTSVIDLSPLRELQKLEVLAISNTPASNLKPLEDLSRLKVFAASGTPLADVSPLHYLVSLQRIYLSHTNIKNLAPLVGLPVLEEIFLQETPAAESVRYPGLSEQEWLRLDGIRVADLPAPQFVIDRLYLGASVLMANHIAAFHAVRRRLQLPSVKIYGMPAQER